MKTQGIFSWPRSERVSDRYGAIGMYETNYNEDATAAVVLDKVALRQLRGKRVHIAARVLEARESGHIGDLFRGIFPSQPAVGEVIDLGVGEFFTDTVDGQFVFGLEPDDDRVIDWFDPEKLYRLHDQTVELDIEEATPVYFSTDRA